MPLLERQVERDRFESSASLRLFVDRVFFFFSFTRTKLLVSSGEEKFVHESRRKIRKKKKRDDFYRLKVGVRRVNRKSFEGGFASRVNYSRGTRCSTTQASLERAKGSTFVIGRVKKRVGRGVLFDAALI